MVYNEPQRKALNEACVPPPLPLNTQVLSAPLPGEFCRGTFGARVPAARKAILQMHFEIEMLEEEREILSGKITGDDSDVLPFTCPTIINAPTYTVK